MKNSRLKIAGITYLTVMVSFLTLSVINSLKKPLDYYLPKSKIEKMISKKEVVTYDTISIDRATTYNAVVGQCDDTPFNTADGSFIDTSLLLQEKVRWVALSRDLIKDDYRDGLFMNRGHWRGYFEFGDTITVSSVSSPQINGKWVVHDCMNARYKKAVDFLFHPKNNNPKLGVCKDLKILIKN